MILGTNEILATKNGITKGQTKALCDRRLSSLQFFCLLLRLKVSVRNLFYKVLSLLIIMALKWILGQSRSMT